MKKIVIALVAVACATVVEAATFSWKSSTAVYGADIDSISGNGSVASGSATAKSQGTWTAVLSIYNGAELVGESAATTVKWSTTGNKFNTTIDVDAAAAGTAYSYVLTITGSPSALTSKEDANWNYAAATLTATLTGDITTAAMAGTTLTTGVPATWTVSGAVQGSVPEPTAGLLFLLGMAGLSLKRKIA